MCRRHGRVSCGRVRRLRGPWLRCGPASRRSLRVRRHSHTEILEAIWCQRHVCGKVARVTSPLRSLSWSAGLTRTPTGAGEEKEWALTVKAFVELRANGINAQIDLFYQSDSSSTGLAGPTNGPRSHFVVIAPSTAWKQRWRGPTPPPWAGSRRRGGHLERPVQQENNTTSNEGRWPSCCRGRRAPICLRTSIASTGSPSAGSLKAITVSKVSCACCSTSRYTRSRS